LLFLPGLIGQVRCSQCLPLFRMQQEDRPARKLVAPADERPLALFSGPIRTRCREQVDYVFLWCCLCSPGHVLQVSLLVGGLASIQEPPVGNLITAFGRVWGWALHERGPGLAAFSPPPFLLSLGHGGTGPRLCYLAAYLAHALMDLLVCRSRSFDAFRHLPERHNRSGITCLRTRSTVPGSLPLDDLSTPQWHSLFPHLESNSERLPSPPNPITPDYPWN